MGDESKRIVWVLGAGFSAGLGGPLLPRLLGLHSEKSLRARFDHKTFLRLYDEDANWVRGLYATGRDELWSDAEEFIDYIDTAAEERRPDESNPHHVRLGLVFDRMNAPYRLSDAQSPAVDAKKLSTAARRLVAAECSAFLESVDPKREQWQPFRSWARSLTSKDTVITFNYDRVLEMLAEWQNSEAQQRAGSSSILNVLRPGHMDDPMTWHGCAPVLKLHGSVDWSKGAVGGKLSVRCADRLHALTCPDDELAIATPGPSKQRETTAFREVWKMARNALTAADVVVFVGYRFPETDADAREQLLNAVGNNGSPGNECRQKLLSLHVVLGRDRDASERLGSLLRFVCARNRDDWTGIQRRSDYGFTLKVHPLYAQDFFTVARREDL